MIKRFSFTTGRVLILWYLCEWVDIRFYLYRKFCYRVNVWLAYVYVCFLLSEVCGDLDNLELGDTVEYTLSKGKGNKVSAEKVTKVAAGSKCLIQFLLININHNYV